MVFANRKEAGRQLGNALGEYRGSDAVVVGLPGGGVPVAAEVARALRVPLDIVVVRKLGVPFQPELAMGAIGEGGVRVVNFPVVRLAHVSDADFRKVEHHERAKLDRRANALRGGNPPLDVKGRTVIVVDDGVATGSTTKAACRVLRTRGARRIIVAVPVGPREVTGMFRQDAERVVCLVTPRKFHAVGEFYWQFPHVEDREVADLLSAARQPDPPVDCDADPDPPLMTTRELVEIPVASIRLGGHLVVPRDAAGLVIFVHGSGSSRHSPRNRAVAASLNNRGLATLLFDLLTPDEEASRRNVFDIDLLASRLLRVTDWAAGRADTGHLALGYFGASTGAAAALVAAAARPDAVRAIVSRGGRPDLAGEAVTDVVAPTLLIVGGADVAVLDLNRQALGQLRCPSQLEVVPGATHLFAEPGALDDVAWLAGCWFTAHLTSVPADRSAS